MSYADWLIETYGVAVDRPTEEQIQAEQDRLEDNEEVLEN